MTGRVRRWLRDLFKFRESDRVLVMQRVEKLKPLPEAHRMRTGPKIKPQPKNFAQWSERYDTRRRRA